MSDSMAFSSSEGMFAGCKTQLTDEVGLMIWITFIIAFLGVGAGQDFKQMSITYQHISGKTVDSHYPTDDLIRIPSQCK